MGHAGKNKCDHDNQRVSPWTCPVTTLTMHVCARGMTWLGPRGGAESLLL